MEEKKTTHLFFFTLLLSLSSAALDHQTLLLSPLPSAPSLSQPESFSEPDSHPSSLSLPLHHLDALSSNQTPSQLFHLRLRRDSLRFHSLTSFAYNRTRPGPSSGFSSSIVSGLSQGSGEYFTRIGVGSPPKYLYMVLDTGSDVVWLQCAPFSYGDGSFTFGDFSTETLTFRRSKVPKVALGCGHDNEGLFVGAAGLLGLGRGKLSFPSQTGSRFNSKFSYCLVDRSASSKPSSVVFGDSAVSRTARFTPLVPNPKLDTFYYMELLGISVGGTRVPGVTASLFKLDPSGNGGVIIDSGTSVTRLTRSARSH
ncbi:hypothetical protein ACLB2K_074366 [Fragaria x ananassa]